jgi:eukaryotic-like serine/threonine-protein kinase
MHRDIAHNPDQLERFRREARAVAQLNHPHIVQVIDAGEEPGTMHPTPYIVFEYVEGETLKDRIRRYGRLDIPEAIAYAIEIARALGAAHERGIVHRDVKPQNILVDEEGSGKVTDFGIARTLEQDGLTADGRVLGTTDYVSPEQALGHPVTGQSDLYSLGVVLFEMLTGDVPFHGDSQVAVAMKHVREELPDIQYRRPEVSSALASVLDHLTAKDLSVRYANDRDVVADLEDVLAIETARAGQATGEATTVLRTLPPSARRRLPLRMRTSMLALVALLVVAGAVVAAVLFFAADRAERGTGVPRETPPPTRANLEPFSLGQDSATDYDPQGDNREEHPDEASAVVDDDPNSAWTTESYNGGTLNKAGVGIYVDADPQVAAPQMSVRTTTPGFRAEVYGAPAGADVPDDIDGWERLAADTRVGERARIDLDLDGRSYRYYLLWITGLPEGRQTVEITQIALYRRQNR